MLLLVTIAAHAENPVFEQVCSTGIPLNPSTDATVALPAPTMADGLNAEQQREVLNAIAERKSPRRRVDDLLKKSVVAPFVWELEKAPVPGSDDPVWRLNAWYVAYGELEPFLEESFVERWLDFSGSRADPRLPVRSESIPADKLEALDIATVDSETSHENYAFSTASLFDRVLLSATRRVLITQDEESVVIAAIVDPRFQDDEDFPNCWQPLTKNSRGEFTIGERQPYVCSGMYMKVTRLQEPDGALLIEYHQLFAEPTEWFDGKNLLRSKIPLAVQDAVRDLRRRLLKASQGSD
jgi:hypothetical protein